MVLIDQTIRHFEREGLFDLGVIQASHPRQNPNARVQIASAQTLIRRQIPEADVVIIDECHIGFGKVNEWITSSEWANVPFIGLSATPWARGMADVWGDLIKPISIQELIDGGYLSPFKVFVEAAPDVSRVRVLGIDFNLEDLSKLSRRVELNANVVDTWLKKGDDRPTIIYAIDRAHARGLTDRFMAAGVVAEYVDCDTPAIEREAIFARYTAGKTRVLCNVAVLDTGLDVDVRCIIDARPTKSRMRFVQTIGRGLRTASGKDHLIVLDHAGNHTRLGLVTEINVRHLLKGADESVGPEAIHEPDPNDPRSGPRNVFEKKGELSNLS